MQLAEAGSRCFYLPQCRWNVLHCVSAADKPVVSSLQHGWCPPTTCWHCVGSEHGQVKSMAQNTACQNITFLREHIYRSKLHNNMSIQNHKRTKGRKRW